MPALICQNLLRNDQNEFISKIQNLDPLIFGPLNFTKMDSSCWPLPGYQIW